MTRFAAVRIKPNFNDSDRKVEIELKKTDWSSLQFSWKYMRRIDLFNHEILDKPNKAAVEKKLREAFLAVGSEELLINSLCLHLIIETKDHKAVLSRISKSKSNDYPSTWAATIGEQISLDDFYNKSKNECYDDFVLRWTKRALLEEFDISSAEMNGDEDEYSRLVEESSLHVLSVDMEADIYNVVLTAVIRLKCSLKELEACQGISMDSEENTELKAVDLGEIRKILLGYPGNCEEYHPSTYLRLLMFHIYRDGISETCRAICNDDKKHKLK